MSLSPFDIDKVTQETLERERRNLERVSLVGDRLSYCDTSDQGIDGHESAREFLDTIEAFVHSKRRDVAYAKQRVKTLSQVTNRKSSPVLIGKGI